jgi:2'-5' RNA ligase
MVSEKKRCFLSVELPVEVVEEIKKVQSKIKDLFVGKLTEPENLHLTLKFLGELSDEQVKAVKNSLRNLDLESFEAELDEVGVFSKQFIKIIWVKLEGVEIQKVVDGILDDLFEKEQRFMSHVTIARVKRVEDKEKLLNTLNNIKVNNLKFKINKFYLKKSVLSTEGPVYTTIEEYDLR